MTPESAAVNFPPVPAEQQIIPLHVADSGENAQVTPVNDEVLVRDSFKTRIGNILHAAGSDTTESQNRFRTISSGVLALGTQALDRARISVVLVPELAVHVLKQTHNPTLAGYAGGALFAGWCLVVGAPLTEGMAQYPRTVKTFDESFPAVANVMEDALPAFHDKSTAHKESMKQTSLARRIGSNTLAHLQRGATAISIGNTAYVATATVRGESKKEVHKLSAITAVDGGAAVGLVVGGVGESIVQLSHTHPELALHIQNDASNIKLWYGVAAGLMALNFMSSRLKKRKMAKLEQVNLATEDVDSSTRLNS